MSNKSNLESYQKIVVDTHIYPINAALSAGYLLTDTIYVFLDMESEDKLAIYIKPKKDSDTNNYHDLFLNQILYEAEKIAVMKRNKKVRDFIVGRALFSNVENTDAQQGEYKEDPLGIATPWEDKYEE
jgi:His-Xaa-Ser system protein HxsD